jgi:hypothetical protein
MDWIGHGNRRSKDAGGDGMFGKWTVDWGMIGWEKVFVSPSPSLFNGLWDDSRNCLKVKKWYILCSHVLAKMSFSPP